jgi:heat shock protein HslJ
MTRFFLMATCLVTGLALAGCAGTRGPSTPAASGDTAVTALSLPYFAMGQEPGWTLEVTADRLAYSGDYGAVRITEAHVGARAAGGVTTISGKRLRLSITPGPCSDGMSDRRYGETVEMMVDGKMLRGCGGAVLPPANLVGSLWRFTHIAGSPVFEPGDTELRFADGTLSATAGCNRMNGPYTLQQSADGQGATLTPGMIAMTRMFCHGIAGAQETGLTALLTGPVTIRYAADGAMLLSGVDGASARAVVMP